MSLLIVPNVRASSSLEFAGIHLPRELSAYSATLTLQRTTTSAQRLTSSTVESALSQRSHAVARAFLAAFLVACNLEALKQLLLAMDPEFPELETRAAALLKAGSGTELQVKAAQLQALHTVPDLRAGLAELIWSFYHPKAGDIPVPMHSHASLSSSQCSLSALLLTQHALNLLLHPPQRHIQQHSEHPQSSIC